MRPARAHHAKWRSTVRCCGADADAAEARCRVAFGLSVLSAGTPDVLHGRRDRRAEAVHVRQHPTGQRRSDRRAERQGREDVSLLPGHAAT